MLSNKIKSEWKLIQCHTYFSIDIEVRRVGGSYGLKLSRQTLVTTACSLVAYKLNRPCRFLMPLKIQTRAVGKRMPSSTNYEVSTYNER